MPKVRSIHYHKYMRLNWPNGKPYYKCCEPNCPHYLPLADLAVGRESLCWGYLCNNLVLITKEDVMRQVKYPHCEECKEKRKEKREELKAI
jgi:hypothetical protein